MPPQPPTEPIVEAPRQRMIAVGRIKPSEPIRYRVGDGKAMTLGRLVASGRVEVPVREGNT